MFKTSLFLLFICRNEIQPYLVFFVVQAGGQEPVALPTEVKVYHADHTHLGSGDKIILSQEVLMACEQQHLAYPVVRPSLPHVSLSLW